MADVKTISLTSPNGLQVSVAADKESEFVAAGYRTVEASEKNAPAKRASSKSEK